MKILLLCVASFFVLACGVFSDVHLGDEVVHYRLARTIYQTRQWPLYDTMNQSYGDQRFYFVDPMLWHTLLAGVWRLTGGVSRLAAQAYQAFFFLFLISSTYVFAAERYDRETALACGFLLASVPVIPALSIILHTDVPVAAVIMGSLAFLSKKRYLLAGILAGCAILMKRTAYVSLPAIFMFCYLEPRGEVGDKLRSWLRFIVPFLLIGSLGFLQLLIIDRVMVSTMKSTDMLYHFSGILRLPLKDLFDLSGDLMKIPLFGGVVMLFSLIIYALRRAFSGKDIPVICAVVSMVLLAYMRLGAGTSVRYLIVALPLAAVIAAVGFRAIRSPRLRGILVAIGVCQFIAAALFTVGQRRLDACSKEFYEAARAHTPAEARIMSSRPDAQLYADRRTIWNNYLSVKEMPFLFWLANTQEALAIFNKYDIDYLLVEKDRIYDDSLEKHQLGWPLSFVRRMDTMSCLKRVLANGQLILYEVIR